MTEQASPGTFEAPNWDQASQKKVRAALLVLATTIPDFSKAFGTKQEADPVRHLIGTAAGWAVIPTRTRRISTLRRLTTTVRPFINST
ncbi:hypothetical protein C8K44_10274 [Aminobacter sp. AP02]|nr:hypothetical protein C8K44_10274 [Aminobacter sp. AP02]